VRLIPWTLQSGSEQVHNAANGHISKTFHQHLLSSSLSKIISIGSRIVRCWLAFLTARLCSDDAKDLLGQAVIKPDVGPQRGKWAFGK
jgi:hypothetical protein